MREEDFKEDLVTFAVAFICCLLLASAIGIYGLVNFFAQSLLGTMSNAFFLMPLLNLIIRGRRANIHQSVFYIALGVVFMMINIHVSQKTAFQIIVDSLKSIVTVLVVAYIVSSLKREARI